METIGQTGEESCEGGGLGASRTADSMGETGGDSGEGDGETLFAAEHSSLCPGGEHRAEWAWRSRQRQGTGCVCFHRPGISQPRPLHDPHVPALTLTFLPSLSRSARRKPVRARTRIDPGTLGLSPRTKSGSPPPPPPPPRPPRPPGAGGEVHELDKRARIPTISPRCPRSQVHKRARIPTISPRCPRSQVHKRARISTISRGGRRGRRGGGRGEKGGGDCS